MGIQQKTTPEIFLRR